MKAEITNFNSSFFEYLCGFIWFNRDRLADLMKRYPIGVTEQGEPIFWHINSEYKITNGRILTMDSETGKVYDDSWYYQDGRPTCLFGEQLLDIFTSQTLALVTDEMTAAVMSCFPTPYVWLATGKEQATPSDLLSLEGKSVVVFPNKGEYSKWQEMLQAVPNLHFHISDVMEKAQGDCHTIAQMVLSQQPLRPTEAEAALIRMEDANPNLALLVKALDLEVMGFSPISDKVKDETPKTKQASKESKANAVMQSILLAQEKRWHGRNPECHKCKLSHEGVNGTFCDKLHRYVEYGKGDCGIEAEIPPAPE
ncbi:DUF6371 domain-containing protein [Prevotella disiens]|uniref:DUF6371 domain-containing protein n=1 Tax=Prevotella disiens TaxID=28130 RepID=UPI00058D7434|nr:DUF6371 domain-containing protein [Prevotella disiens]